MSPMNTIAVIDELLALTILHRHGDRTPMFFYPNDPYKDPSFWSSVGPGDLTNTGKRQMYELGKWIRQRYDGFLSKNYKQDEIYVLSSDIDRCLRSAAAVLAGLYPPEGEDVWNPNLAWNPVPIHSVPKNYDNMLYYLDSCPKYRKLGFEMMKLMDEKHKDTYEYLEKHSGKKINTLIDAAYLFDTLLIEEQNNLTLPEWTNKVYPQPLHSIRNEFDYLQTCTPEITRLAVGRFFHELLKNYEPYVAETAAKCEPKFKLYSAHDINIQVVLESLKIPHSVDIPIAAALMFELRRSETGDIYVQIVYKTDKVEYLQITDKGIKCEYREFANILKTFALSDAEHKAQCVI